MSCYGFRDQYANETENDQKEIVLDNAINCLEEEDARRTQELYEFIDDFINSQEYLDYVEEKKKLVKHSVYTQYDLNDIIVEYKHKGMSEKYPLTEEQKKMKAFKQSFEKYAERQSTQINYPLTEQRKKMYALKEDTEKLAEEKIMLEKLKKQERGIQAIREKINEAKIFFECTGESWQRKRERRDEKILQYYSNKLGTDLTKFGPELRAVILERIKTHHRETCLRKERKRQNIFKILNKLTIENKIKKDVIRFQNKTFDYKVKRKEKIIPDMEVVGTKIELIDRQQKAEVPEEPKIEEETEIEVEQQDKKAKKKGNDKDKKGNKEKKEKKEKKPKTDKPKKEKTAKGKKKDKKEAKLELPFVPLVNPREKILPENIDKMLELVEEYRNFDNELENRDMIREKNRIYICGDTGLKSKPDTILFQNFEEGKSYYKSIVISNVSTQIRKVRFLKFMFPNQYDEVVFEVKNFGIKKLFTGCQVKFWLNFQPYDSFKCYEGKMLFLSYAAQQCQYYQFDLDIKCLPKYSNLQIYPSMINFGRIPIWKAKNHQNCKIVKIQNKGAKNCVIYIHKMLDPLDIESILDEQNKENIAPVPKNSATSMQEEVECIQNIIDMCIENIDNNFYFEDSFLKINQFEEKRIKVFLQNANYIGDYSEKFIVDVYEQSRHGDIESVGCQEISLVAETTGHCITVSPEILDFGICQINSCYQLSFEIFNNSKNTQAISVRFPTNIADMIQADNSTMFISPHDKRVVWFKFLPRDYIFRDSCTYFDKYTCILEFPIQIYMVSKNYQDYPVIKLTVYAILSNTEDLTITIHLNSSSLSNFLDTILVNMGICSIYETIWTDIFLQNNTFLTHVCGFMDLPQCLTIEPNCGFVKLYPNQTKKLKLYLSPEIKDFPSFSIGSLRNNKYFFKLRIDTIGNVGKIKREINPRKLKSSIELMLKELAKRDSQDLLNSMLGFVTQLKEDTNQEISHSMMNKARNMCSTDKMKDTPDITFSRDEVTKSFDDTILNYQNFVIVETTSRQDIWCKVTLKRPLVEFSYQTVEFPDTPCGSYSVMDIQLTAIEKEMEYKCESVSKKKRNALNFIMHFRIMGSSQEISIEPTCGVLRSGQSTKITLLAKPQVPKEIVEQTAKSIKYSEIYEMKLKEFQALRSKKQGKKAKGKESKGKKETGKKNKNDKSKTRKETKKESKNSKSTKKKDGNKKIHKDKTDTSPTDEEPNIIITDKELEYEYLDLYPAEMVYWRSLEPYYIKTKFTCLIEYEHEIKIRKKPDRIYLDAICKVVRPDFSTSLNLQRIDFGKCIIGMTTTKEIFLQNIKYDDIKLKTTLLNPVGGFSIPFIRDLTVPPEHSLKLPIRFSPVSTEKVTEYFEVKSNATVLPLILCGEGILPMINITPEFSVFRLETKQNRLAEVHIKIENLSESEVYIRLEKLFEIEANTGDVGKLKQDIKEKAASPMDKKEKKTKEKKSQVKEKGPKFSDSLIERELEAIDNCFSILKGESHFDISSTDNLIIQSNTNHNLTIFFGEPELLQKRKAEKLKKDKKEKGKGRKDKSEGQESKKSGDSKKSTDNGKQYITQYNVFVGKAYIKSIVLVGTSY